MRKLLLTICLLAAFTLTASAQRFTDKLDRGLVAVPAASGNFVSWRRQANEYYDVTYNLYRGSTQVASGLSVTNFTDTGGNSNSTYQVEAVVSGVTPTKCDAVGLWHDYKYTLNNTHTGYIDITLAAVYDRKGDDVTTNYSPNDAEMADLDGDGQLEIIIKRLNTADAGTQINNEMYSTQSTQFVVLDAYDVNWQTGAATLMWRIDCGPNMVSMNSTETNIIAYDWDEDGKAEVVLRGADNMIVYGSNGKTALYTIGENVNTRDKMDSHTNAQYAWTRFGREYLIYMNGQTGELYQQIDYPLPRIEQSEWPSGVTYNDWEALANAKTDEQIFGTNKKSGILKSAWGDHYGHRSTKHFMGAPFLDGRKASLFLARGIYTRHKMIAMDLNRGTHQWSQRWRWNNNSKSSPWYGNGYHNFVIADVDEDGRDEIVYGSMVIDDNGKGLSTTGYGHGDAQHVSDFNPYRKGLEFFGCLEDSPYWGSDYRDATTGEVLYKHTGTGDDGRALMGNFSNNYPGSIGRSVGSGMIATLRKNTTIEALSGDSYIEWGNLNFRIYWDGDLCSEILNSPGNARDAKIDKPGLGRLFTSSGCNMNNDSKNNPCFQGDIIGDWREEIVVRCGTNIRVYTTTYPTTYSMPCLWFDHQYRQAMVWQMMAYNQPPHVSYFLGELEGITIAPPPLTMEGREEVSSGSITSALNGQHVLLCDASSVGIDAGGISPSVLTVNVNSTVAGNDNNSNISTSYKSTQLGDGSNKGDITGSTRLVKQGDGLLKLTNREFTYSGQTDIWGGTLRFRGTLTNSDVWMNRHTAFFSGATINKSLTMEYGATLYPTYGDVSDASKASYGTTTIKGTLELHEGARIVFQLDPENSKYDQVNIGTLAVRKRSGEAWENYGPEYLKPVIEIQAASALGGTGIYTLGTLNGLATGTSLSDIIVEGAGEKATLLFEDNKLKLKVGDEEVTAPTVTGDGRIKYVTPGESTAGNEVSVYYTTAASDNPAAEGTKMEKNYVGMPNNSTYYFYTVSSTGITSPAATAEFDGIITETYPFQEWAGNNYLTLNTSGNAFNIGEQHYYATSVSNGSSSHSLNNRFGLRSSANYFFMRYKDSATNDYTGLFCNKDKDRLIGIMNLNPGDKFTVTMASGTLYFRNSNVYLESDANKTKVAYGTSNETGTALTSGATYVVADDAEENCYVLFGTNSAFVCIKTVTISVPAVDETVGKPSINIDAAYEGTRTISITPGVGSQGTVATETYYTLDGSDPSDESNANRVLYTEPFDISATTTVKAMSYLIDTKGAVAEKQITAGENLTLAAPRFTKTDYASGAYKIAIWSDQSSLAAAPATIDYFYSVDGGEIMRVGEGGLATVYGGSTLTAYATADGYNESTTAELVLTPMPIFDNEWEIDFTKIAATSYLDAKVGSYSQLKDNSTNNTLNENFGVSGDGTSGNNAFIHNGGLYLMFGSGSNIAFNVNEGQYVVVVTSGVVNSAAGMTLTNCSYGNTYIYKANTTGVCTVNIARYSVITYVAVLNEIDNPTVSKTISNAGWATYCSPYAMDFSGEIANLTKAYYVTGIKANGTTLTLLEVNGIVPAGTGVLLRGEGVCEIPVLSGSNASTEGNLLVGVLEETELEANSIYVLLKEDEKVGFFKNNYAFTVGAQTAYLPSEAIDGLTAIPTNARDFQFVENEEATGIHEILRPIGENRYYNLNGQRVAKPTKSGIYIIDGRKVIIKK